MAILRCVRCRRYKPHKAFSAYALEQGNQRWCKLCRRKYDRQYARRRRSAQRLLGDSRRSLVLSAPRSIREKSHAAVSHALRRGALTRPESCEMCGQRCVPVAHHDSYAAEDRLRVAWLCRECHDWTHNRRRDGPRSSVASQPRK